SAVTVVSWARRSRRPIPPDALGLGLLCVAGFLALGLAVRDIGDWRTYHGVLAGQALAGWFLLLAAWRSSGLHLPALAEDQRAGAWSALVALGLVVIAGLANDAAEGGVRPDAFLGWAALSAAAIAMAAGLWDDRSRATVAGLYLLGLCAAGWSVHQYHLPP